MKLKTGTSIARVILRLSFLMFGIFLVLHITPIVNSVHIFEARHYNLLMMAWFIVAISLASIVGSFETTSDPLNNALNGITHGIIGMVSILMGACLMIIMFTVYSLMPFGAVVAGSVAIVLLYGGATFLIRS